MNSDKLCNTELSDADLIAAEISDAEFFEMLKERLLLKTTFKKLMTISCNTDGMIQLADDAEEAVIEACHTVGKASLQGWAESLATQTAHQVETHMSSASKDVKKKVHWQTTYGEISITEQIYSQPKGGSRIRPFVLAAGVGTRGYSGPLQRRIVDFAADASFAKVNDKLEEHYGISVPVSAIRQITLNHAKQINIEQEQTLGQQEAPEQSCIVCEMDGSMVPIVQTEEVEAETGEKIDKRKNKKLVYKEAKLTLAHEKDSKTPVFGATMGSVDKAGQHLFDCAKQVGLGKETKVHCVGDGAPWIAERVETHFGSKATYVIDFFHLCEYLSAAAAVCAPDNKSSWLDKQKSLLKASSPLQVLRALRPHLESPDLTGEQAPVQACYRYIKNRLHQLDYKTAIEQDLPIGSGEIESAHRYIVQDRLKIAGAWWTEENADNMLALRTNRANKQWHNYWKKRRTG